MYLNTVKSFVADILCCFTFFAVFLFVSPLLCAESSDFNSGKPNKGFRLSQDSNLDIYFSFSTEYESNVSKKSEKTFYTLNGSKTYLSIDPDLIFHFKPGVKYKIADSEKLFAAAFLMNYNHYSGISTEDTKKSSSLEFNFDMDGHFNKKSLAQFMFTNKFKRSSTPESQLLSGIHSNILENGDASLILASRANVLMMKLTGGFGINYFEEDIDKASNYMVLRSALYARWKFLPKTSLFLNASFSYQDYYDSDSLTDWQGNTYDIRDAQKTMPLNVFAGVLGQITSKLSLRISGGYVNMFNQDATQGFTVNSELVFRMNRNSLARAGYLRSYAPVPSYQYLLQNRFYISYKHRFFNRLIAALDTSFTIRDFGRNIDESNSATFDSTRAENLLKISPYLGVDITPWIGLKLEYLLESRMTDYNYTVDLYTNVDNSKIGELATWFDYVNHSVMLTVTVDY